MHSPRPTDDWYTRAKVSAPRPPDEVDAHLMAEADERLALLTGRWVDDLAHHIEVQLGALRAKLVGRPDTSSNLALSVAKQTSNCFATEPEISGPGAKELTACLDEAGWSVLAQTMERWLSLLRKVWVYVGWDPLEEEVWLELVAGNRVYTRPMPGNPTKTGLWAWAKRLPVPGHPNPHERAWFWHIWDVRDRDNPSFRIVTNDHRRDMTREFGVDPGEWSGSAYPYKDDKGRPILPVGEYCLEDHPRSELVFGTWQVGLLWTAMVHGFLRASWAQNYIVNGMLKGGTTKEVDGRPVRLITPDPTKWMEVRSTGSGTASVGQVGAAIDIEVGERVTRLYEARLCVHFDLSPSDLVIESLNPASGASITVSNEGKRRVASSRRPLIARGDKGLYRAVAAVKRGRSDSKLRGTGYRTRYGGVALTANERVTVGSFVKAEMDMGLLDDIGAYMELHPGTDREAAKAALDVIVKRTAQRQIATKALVAPSAPPPADGPPEPEPDPNRDTDDDGADDEEGARAAA